jgi:hypothetical protein
MEELKKPGGQPGNQNARKFGFYAKYYKRGEKEDLENVPSKSMVDEISMIRVSIRRYFQYSEEATTTSEKIQYGRILSTFIMALTRLMRTHYMSLKGEDEDAEAKFWDRHYDEMLKMVYKSDMEALYGPGNQGPNPLKSMDH